MYTQVITPLENPVTLEIPRELLGHQIKVTMDDMEVNGHEHIASLEDVLSHFTAVRIDTRGFTFDRDEANAR
jgi:hypothetical protein